MRDFILEKQIEMTELREKFDSECEAFRQANYVAVGVPPTSWLRVGSAATSHCRR
jgi:hypothetical protein